MKPLQDRFGRSIEYLRISVTDRCNLRCLYCLPRWTSAASVQRGLSAPSWGCPFQGRQEILTYEEIVCIAGIMARLGVSRFRLTGGEPLLRRDLAELVAGLSRIPGIEDLALSTNGVLLGAQAFALQKAGLRRVNISLDTLDPDRFRQITRGGDWRRVWQGIWMALEVGLVPTKLNVVLMKGVNEADIRPFAELTRKHPLHVRFIELMPHGNGVLNHAAHFFSAGEARTICEQMGPLVPARDVAGAGPAASFRYPGAKGSIGFIGALSCNFCRRCNRMRLTADGFLRPCLDNRAGVSLREALRQGAGEEELADRIREAVALKPESHTMQVGQGGMGWEPMCAVGG